jgi:hypothetical protein
VNAFQEINEDPLPVVPLRQYVILIIHIHIATSMLTGKL